MLLVTILLKQTPSKPSPKITFQTHWAGTSSEQAHLSSHSNVNTWISVKHRENGHNFYSLMVSNLIVVLLGEDVRQGLVEDVVHQQNGSHQSHSFCRAIKSAFNNKTHGQVHIDLPLSDTKMDTESMLLHWPLEATCRPHNHPWCLRRILPVGRKWSVSDGASGCWVCTRFSEGTLSHSPALSVYTEHLLALPW